MDDPILICEGCGKPMPNFPKGTVYGITENQYYCCRACLPKHNYPIELWPITGLRMVTVRDPQETWPRPQRRVAFGVFSA